MSVFALNLIIGLGLGLAIDYSLFVVSRFREELERGAATADALVATVRTAGRTVIFSAATVAAALASLLVFPQRFLYSMGVGGVLVTSWPRPSRSSFLPALLAALGPRVNARRPARWRRAAQRDAAAVAGGLLVPALAVGDAAAGHDRRRHRDAADRARAPVHGDQVHRRRRDACSGTSHSARVVDDALRTEFPPNRTSPIVVAARAPAARRGDAVTPVRAPPRRGARRARACSRPRRPAACGGSAWWRRAAASTSRPRTRSARCAPCRRRSRCRSAARRRSSSTSSPRWRPTCRRARDPRRDDARDPLPDDGLGDPPRQDADHEPADGQRRVRDPQADLPGRQARGLLGYTSQGALESSQPILLFAIAFGLSTDYGVFLLTRIKEARDSGLSNDEAVAVGLQRTGRIVTAAAILFCIAIGAFVTSEMIFIKELGLGTALAVLIDATIVRALLVPSLMKLLGEWNWWAPRPLARLHARIGLSEGLPA